MVTDMMEFDVLIVGGGPAGASCAWKLQKHGLSVAILDKQTFPRKKLCAGWITPDVFNNLLTAPGDYPHGLKTFRKLIYYVYGIRIPVRTRQYSIRRYEFDHWLIQKSEAPLLYHQVKDISKEDDRYVIDNKYCCKFLVGAGGTFCPVHKHFFKGKYPRSRKHLIATMEEEFSFPYVDKSCYLWFFENGLPGYAWYVPKENGYLNVGIGGKLHSMKKKGTTLRHYWNLFTEKLDKKGFVKNYRFQPGAYTYYVRKKTCRFQKGRIYLTGDAAGLATTDMGEGIGPAVKSGLLAAESIVFDKPYHPDRIGRYSLKQILLP